MLYFVHEFEEFFNSERKNSKIWRARVVFVNRTTMKYIPMYLIILIWVDSGVDTVEIED